jgi:Ni,Fe-hydrogenase III large subunit
MKNMITIGGLKKDVSNESLEKLSKYLTDFIKQFTKYVKESLSLTTVIDRLVTTGIVKESLIRPLHLTGPIARAINNTKKDERVNHSYGVYKNKELDIIGDQNGDVLARFNVKQQEIVKSAKIIQMQIENLQEGHYQISVSKVTTGYATSIVEAPRGQNFHFVYVKNGKIDRYKVRTASYCNWQAIQHAVIGNIVPDFPLINKSFNLSYAGTDL